MTEGVRISLTPSPFPFEHQSQQRTGAWEFDIQTSRMFWNPELYRIFGLKIEDKIDLDQVIDRIHPDYRSLATADLKKLRDEHKPFQSRWKIFDRKGGAHWIQSEGFPHYDPEGKVDKVMGIIRDIDEEKSNREQVEILSLVAQNMRSASAILNSEGVIVWANHAFIQMMGLDLPAARGRLIDEFIQSPEGDSHTIDYIRYRRKIGKPCSVEHQIVSTVGKVFWVDLEVTPVFDPSGQVEKFVFIANDISAQIESRIRLQESESRYRDLVQASGEFIWEVDLKGRFVYSTDRVTQVLGYFPEELIGTYALRLAEPDSRKSILRAIRELPKQGNRGLRQYEILFRHKNGQPRWLRLNGIPSQRNGIPVGMRGTGLDITDRKEVESQLRRLNTRYELATESAKIGIWDYDLEKDLHIWDGRMFEIYGINPNKFDGLTRSWHKLIHRIDLPLLKEKLHRATEMGRMEALEFRIFRPSGEMRVVESAFTSLKNPKGKTLRLVGVNRDVTDRKRDETSLQEAKESAEAANRAKSAFLAMMSHEIRTPMNGVVGMTSILEETYLSKAQRHYLSIIRESSKALMNILNDILDFSKYEADGLRFDFDSVNLIDLVESSADVHMGSAWRKELDIITLIDPALPIYFRSDETRLRQILTNILGNAVKFSHSGEIVLRVGHRIENHISKVVFQIEDEGIGIPGESLQNIFLPFWQVDSSATRKFEGTGLGLSICKRLVEFMGGEIWAENRKTKSGLWVGFSLPMTLPSTGFVNFKQFFGDLKSQRILFLNGKESANNFISAFLQHWDVDLRTFSSAEEVLSHFLKDFWRPNVIIAEDSLSDGGGIQLVQKLRRRKGWKGIPLIQVQGRNPIKTKTKAIHLLQKPVKRKALFDALLRAHGDLPPEDVEKATSQAPDLKLLRVLLCEDNKVNQRVTALIARVFGITLEIREDGYEAVRAVKEKDWDLVLMDLQMPRMDGIEAIRAIRNLKGKIQPKIYVLSAAVMPTNQEEAKKAGADGFIKKPVNKDALKSVFQRCAESLRGAELKSRK